MSPAETTRFGKYELLDRIAAGGMAEIFRARYEPAPGVTKQVVIKRILPHYAENKAFIAMFTNEAKIVMGLSHGNIAQVFDFGAIDGDYFLAMELVDGHPLSKVVKRARTLGIPVLPPEYAAFICAEMLKGLHYAHARLDEQGRPLKIVHRDVSPQNVLISYEGQVKLVDFGIAKARNASGEETAANAVKGKYAYFAPEQAKAKELDARTDVFAAGIVLVRAAHRAAALPGPADGRDGPHRARAVPEAARAEPAHPARSRAGGAQGDGPGEGRSLPDRRGLPAGPQPLPRQQPPRVHRRHAHPTSSSCSSRRSW